MLGFLRRNAALIGWVIIISFGLTMFAGALLFRNSYKKQGNVKRGQLIDTSNEIAVLGQTPVNKQKYYEQISQAASYMQKNNRYIEISPEMQELIHFSAFNQALQYTILFEGAKQHKIKVSKAEIQQNMANIYKLYNMKGKKELKKMLAENNYPYKIFMENLKNDILVQVFAKNLTSSVFVNNKDVDNKYTDIKVDHILIKKDNEADSRLSALTRARNVLNQIKKGLSFQDAVTTYSEDPGTKTTGGGLGWISTGDTVGAFEDIAFSLDKGEISNPVLTTYGYHLIRVVDKKRKTGFDNIDYEKEKEMILKEKQDSAVTDYIQKVLSNDKLEIFDSVLRAYDAKSKGNIDIAIPAYQAQISNNPASPVPHYLLAKMYWMLEDKEKARKELMKAVVKGEMYPALDLVSVHFMLGDLFVEDFYSGKEIKGSLKRKIKMRYDRAMRKYEAGQKNMQQDKSNAYNQLPDLIRISRIEVGKKYKEKNLPEKIIKQYDKVMELSGNNINALKKLRNIYQELNAQDRFKKVEIEIARVESLIAESREDKVKEMEKKEDKVIELDSQDLKIFDK
ncbi:MAG: hypothetical protein GY730_04390 [bacterium]|nr:hypothetical protein [bacterium]